MTRAAGLLSRTLRVCRRAGRLVLFMRKPSPVRERVSRSEKPGLVQPDQFLDHHVFAFLVVRVLEVGAEQPCDALPEKRAKAAPEFLDQFKGAEAPVFLPGMDVSAGSEDSSAEAEPAKEETDLTVLEGAELSDGTYEAKTSEPDSNGFTEVVTLTVKDGAITEANWDAVTEDGSKKSVMSENGEYTMTEDGLTWKAQAEALAEALIENQSLSFLTTDAEGKTDAVTGVSISVNGFIDLATQCLEQAVATDAPEETEEAPAEEAPASGEGTQIDAVSGATKSSTAAVNGINDAYNFLQTVK